MRGRARRRAGGRGADGRLAAGRRPALRASGGVRCGSRADEILCVVGESGSGKSMMADGRHGPAAARAARRTGRVLLEGEDLAGAAGGGDAPDRGAGGSAMIFQEPMTALNPLRTIGDQIAEMSRTHTDLSAAEIRARSLEAAAGGRDAGPGGRAARLSARTLRRAAPARDDRHGARAGAGGADRRRADDRARRDDPGADPVAHPRSPAAAAARRCCSSPTISAWWRRSPTGSR